MSQPTAPKNPTPPLLEDKNHPNLILDNDMIRQQHHEIAKLMTTQQATRSMYAAATEVITIILPSPTAPKND